MGGAKRMTQSEKEIHPPKGYYRTTGEWMAYHLARETSMEGHFIELYGDHSSEFHMPKGLDETIPWELRQNLRRSHPNPFVAVIPDGRIWGWKGAVITPDNKLLWDVSIEHVEKAAEQHSVFAQDSLPPAEYVPDTVGVLTYTASDSYFHWMLDVLPRMDLIQKSGIAIDKFAFNTIPSSPFQQESLAILGIPPEKRLEIGGNVHLKAKRLVVPSLIGYTSNYPKWAVDFLRKEFSQQADAGRTGEYQRIYLSRADASHRKVTNEDQVMDVLEAYRFKKITLSDFSIAEQIGIFASAQIIVSPHGANLTNLVFCRPGTKVIELFSPGYVNLIYWVMSNHVGVDYSYLIGSGRRSPENVYELSRGKEDVEVNVDQLSRIIELAAT
jgi:capsular polysaccharide biosynthesis protein